MTTTDALPEPTAATTRTTGAVALRRRAEGRARALLGRAGARVRLALAGDEGMSTVEYCLGTVGAAAFGALLYTVVTGDGITTAITGIIERALSTK